MYDLSDRIKKVRKDNNLTQKDFGEKVVCSGSYISKVESGKEAPSEMFLRIIALQFKISYDWLLYGTGNMRDSNDGYGLDAPLKSNNLINSELLKVQSALASINSERDIFNVNDILKNIESILLMETATKAQKSIILEIFRDIVNMAGFFIDSYSRVDPANPHAMDKSVEYFFSKCKDEMLEVKDVFLSSFLE